MAPAPRPTRRAVLLGVPAAAGLAALASCTSGWDKPVAPAPVNPDVALRAEAVLREQTLIRAYDTALLAAPALGERLRTLRAEHLTHLTALGAPPESSPTSPTPLVTPGASTTATASQLAAALMGLRSAERAAGAGHTAALRTASVELAVVLATLAASEASHEVALT